jgi:teichoic acid transport system permease protein
VIHTVFNLGLAALAGRIAVPFRDVNNLIPYLLRLWLYVSPIIITAQYISEIPKGWQLQLFNLNPLVPLLAVYRAALTGAELASSDLLAAAAWAFGIAAVAIAAFVKYEGRMARYL